MKLPVPSKLTLNQNLNLKDQIKYLVEYLTKLCNALQPYIDYIDEQQRKE